MYRFGYLEPQEDFHTRLLNEHWNTKYEEPKEEIQRKINEILKRYINATS